MVSSDYTRVLPRLKKMVFPDLTHRCVNAHFNTPLYNFLSKNLNISNFPFQINQTSVDWPLEINIDGQGFFGPPFCLAKAMQTTYYPLMFRPSLEALISVSVAFLLLSNNQMIRFVTNHCICNNLNRAANCKWRFLIFGSKFKYLKSSFVMHAFLCQSIKIKNNFY